MRKNLFRGKTKEGKWVYGGYYETECCDGDGLCSFIKINGVSNGVKITHETVGQFTGLTDKNGVKIFEGDVLEKETYMVNAFTGKKVDNSEHKAIYAVLSDVYGNYLINIKDIGTDTEKSFMRKRANYIQMITDESHIIGNIHDNPELLEEEC